MGVTNLWQVLSPVQQNKPMSSLIGKTIAVDLSIWICENQCVKQMQGVVARPYLRNLYFRISCLIHLGINLIFAVEGDAPELKQETMSRRQEAQYPGKRKGPPRGPPKRKPGRSQFNAKLRECCEMLDYLGVPYIQSKGEAEALCGLLNAAGIVDGCITNDGDVFLYGAKTVYRNFSINSKDPHIEVYDMNDIGESLRLDREKMVALALLVGCDYVPKGVPGVGIERATKLLASYCGISPLQRFKLWKKLSDHDCFDSVEVQIKKKAMVVADFPQKKVIDEFLIPKDPLPSRKIEWKRPKLVQLQSFSLTKLEWPEEYTQDKVLPLITLWDMQDIIKGGNQVHLTPHRVVKARVRQGIPSYEVEWNKQTDDRFCQTDYYITIEDRELFSNCFPGLVEEYEKEVAEKKSKTKGRKKKAKEKDGSDIVVHEGENVEELSEQFDDMSLNCRTEKNPQIATPNECESQAGLVSDILQVTDALESFDIETMNNYVQKERTLSRERGKECSSSKKGGLYNKHEENINSSNSSDDGSSSNCLELEVSCTEENLSLRSRLMRKASTKTSTRSSHKTVSLSDFLGSSDSESDQGEKPGFGCSDGEINICRTHGFETMIDEVAPLLRTPKAGITDEIQLNNSLPVFTPEKLPTLSKAEFKLKPEFEESNMKIYNVSDFSHIGRLNIDLNTPNMNRLRNLSPGLYQTLLESTPTSSIKLRKAALLKSILNSPLQVDAILNAFNKDDHNVSPVLGFAKEPRSLEKTLGNLSNLSLNGTSMALGNFQIESSLLRSIIASGGSTCASFGSPDNLGTTETPHSRVTKGQQADIMCDTPDEKCIVGKLSFDHVNSPSIPVPHEENSEKSTCEADMDTRKSAPDISNEYQLSGNARESFIDLTCETPEHDQKCKISICSKKHSTGPDLSKENNECHNSLPSFASPSLPSKTTSMGDHNLYSECDFSKTSHLSKNYQKSNLNSCNSKCMDCSKSYHQIDLSCDSKKVGNSENMENSVVNDKISTSISFSESFSYSEPSCGGWIASMADKACMQNISASNLSEMEFNSTMCTSFDERSPVSLADRLRKKLNVTTMKGVLQEFTKK